MAKLEGIGVVIETKPSGDVLVETVDDDGGPRGFSLHPGVTDLRRFLTEALAALPKDDADAPV